MWFVWVSSFFVRSYCTSLSCFVCLLFTYRPWFFSSLHLAFVGATIVAGIWIVCMTPPSSGLSAVLLFECQSFRLYVYKWTMQLYDKANVRFLFTIILSMNIMNCWKVHALIRNLLIFTHFRLIDFIIDSGLQTIGTIIEFINAIGRSQLFELLKIYHKYRNPHGSKPFALAHCKNMCGKSTDSFRLATTQTINSMKWKLLPILLPYSLQRWRYQSITVTKDFYYNEHISKNRYSRIAYRQFSIIQQIINCFVFFLVFFNEL